jgi:hypothetical protein
MLNASRIPVAETFRRGTQCASRSRLWRAAHVAAVLLLVSSARAATGSEGWSEDETALARDPKPSPSPPPPPPPPLTPTDKLLAARFVFDAELRSGIGWGSLSQFVPVYNEDAFFGTSGKDYALTDLTLGGVDLSLALGAFLSQHWKLGYETAGGLRGVVSTRNTLQVSRSLPSDEQPSVPSRKALQQPAGYLLPVGGYLAFYPSFSQSGGFSIGLHLGGGLFWGGEYMGHGGPHLAATGAADLGYDYAWSDHLAWGARIRCGQMAFKGSEDADERITSLGATELSLALHLSAF